MALADETDPRTAVVNMLDDEATDSDYTEAGSKPGVIEAVEASPRKTKRTDRSDAIYVWQPADAGIEKMGAAGDERRETPVVQAEAWTTASAGQAEALREDIISITGSYSNDSMQNTQFVDVFPTTVTDFRHEHHRLQGGHYVEAVQVILRRKAVV